ncbi:hypothetical protein [uncultured Litoreibacter sp.]|uniref:hypothetical protein n=1 Tax=uncultured Litoreibacter sp. TaxID=1392394 RepID=UPI00260F1D98|nr:hypothetical protein [uncultured Litoreibacter sp.]
MRFLAIFLLFCSCSTPSVGLMGGAKETVQVGQYSFTVRHKGDSAEAYRTNMMRRPKAREVFAAGATAIERVTGCHVVRSTVSGDVAYLRADILC